MSSNRSWNPQSNRRSNRPVVVAIVLAGLVLVLAVGLAIALSGEEGGGGDQTAFAPVSVQGTALEAFTSPEVDGAVGQSAPRLVGQGPGGVVAEVGGTGQPTLVAFLAHWCPHCQREVPVLVDLAESGALDGVRLVGVLTGSDPAAPNYPPAAWLEDEGWPGAAMFDDEEATAASAYGLAGYPFMVMLDADGQVVARTSGEVPADQILAMAAAAGA